MLKAHKHAYSSLGVGFMHNNSFLSTIIHSKLKKHCYWKKFFSGNKDFFSISVFQMKS